MSLVLKEVRQGKSYPDLIRILINEGVPEEDANTFLNNVIDVQFIVNELEPTFVGEDYLSYLVDRLKEINCTHAVFNSLNKVFVLIKTLDDNTDGYYECYEEIFREFSNLKIPVIRKLFFRLTYLSPLPVAL